MADPTTGARRRRAWRAGFILIAVLGLTAVVASLGIAFLEANATAMPESINYLGSVRAQYLADSGVALASHFLMYPPTNVPYDQYYTGANSVAVDASADYFNVSVLRSDAWSPPQSDPNLYRISAAGVALNADGSIRGKRSVTADVLVNPTGKWHIPYAYLATATTTIPSYVRINGNVHSNGTLTGFGWCQGKVSASVTATWAGSGPPSQLQSLAPAFTPYPSVTAANYATYTIRGKTYTAYTGLTAAEINSTNAAALNAIDMSATNPGRIIMARSGNFKIRRNADLYGTLVVQGGRLEVDDSGWRRIRAVPGFPALIVPGEIRVLNDDCTFDVVGPVICGDKININDADRFVLNVTGTCIVPNGMLTPGSSPLLTYTWDVQRATFWDFDNPPVRKPITILSWREQ